MACPHEYANTAEWWDAECITGKRHADMAPRDLHQVHGGVGAATWGQRRMVAKTTHGEKVRFGSVARGGAAAADFVPTEPTPAKEVASFEILNNGDRRSTKLLTMSEEQSKDVRYLLEAHGFDPVHWEVVNARNNIWDVFSKNAEGDQEISTLYSSKLTVRPCANGIDFDELVRVVSAVKPLTITLPKNTDPRMLEISLHDMHFGVSCLDTYRPTLERISQRIQSRKWDMVVVPVGSDLFHNDNFRGTTAKGTPIEGMDWPEAWSGALTFYSTLLKDSLKHSREVRLIYIKGNHDESMSWAFCQCLAAMFPQLVCDLDIRERKVVTYERVCLGLTHGGKSKAKDLDRLFNAEFPEFSSATVKEIHSGHEHHEETVDNYGVLTRKLPSGNKTDSWHSDRGFVGAVKRFAIFEYSAASIEHIHYV